MKEYSKKSSFPTCDEKFQWLNLAVICAQSIDVKRHPVKIMG